MLGLHHEVVNLATTDRYERVQALKRIIPSCVIQSSLSQTGQDAYCARLPKPFMVWFVIGLGLFCTDGYRQVYRWLTRFQARGTPGRSTLCEARQRLGVAPLRRLFERIVRLRGTPGTPGCFYRGLRLMAVDGFVLDVADTTANDRVFGRPRNGRAVCAFPQARVLALCVPAWRLLSCQLSFSGEDIHLAQRPLHSFRPLLPFSPG